MAVISNKMIELVNFRIEQEELSSRLYLAMSLWLDVNGYAGAAKLWKSYSDEELGHAKWSYEYLTDLNILPKVPKLDQPQTDFQGLPTIIVDSYKHELKITAQCQEFAREAQGEGDYMTLNLAQKFLKEQVDEIAKTTYWVDRLKAFGNDKIALRLLDNEMGG
jgi:ferritin